jgi:hypothetical protein
MAEIEIYTLMVKNAQKRNRGKKLRNLDIAQFEKHKPEIRAQIYFQY